MKRIIHVNRHHIAHNRKHPDEPAKLVFTVKTYKSNDYGDEVDFTNGRLQYTPGTPLSCGAEAYIVTHEPVTVDGKII